MKKNTHRVLLTLLLVLTIFIGGGSLLFLVYFLLAGPAEWLRTDMNNIQKLGWNSTLCLFFFFQHSIMIRRFFKNHLESWISRRYHGSLYSIASGSALFILIILWQPVPPDFITLPSWITYCLYILFISTGIIFFFSIRALPALDTFGVGPLIQSRTDDSNDIPSPSQHLIIKGPYRWVRHPLYLAFIIASWATPHITADRLLFNVLWTTWIYFAMHLEEQDLIVGFGEQYKEYQKKVPMVLPKSLRPII